MRKNDAIAVLNALDSFRKEADKRVTGELLDFQEFRIRRASKIQENGIIFGLASWNFSATYSGRGDIDYDYPCCLLKYVKDEWKIIPEGIPEKEKDNFKHLIKAHEFLNHMKHNHFYSDRIPEWLWGKKANQVNNISSEDFHTAALYRAILGDEKAILTGILSQVAGLDNLMDPIVATQYKMLLKVNHDHITSKRIDLFLKNNGNALIIEAKRKDGSFEDLKDEVKDRLDFAKRLNNDGYCSKILLVIYGNCTGSDQDFYKKKWNRIIHDMKYSPFLAKDILFWDQIKDEVFRNVNNWVNSDPSFNLFSSKREGMLKLSELPMLIHGRSFRKLLDIRSNYRQLMEEYGYECGF